MKIFTYVYVLIAQWDPAHRTLLLRIVMLSRYWPRLTLALTARRMTIVSVIGLDSVFACVLPYGGSRAVEASIRLHRMNNVWWSITDTGPAMYFPMTLNMITRFRVFGMRSGRTDVIGVPTLAFPFHDSPEFMTKFIVNTAKYKIRGGVGPSQSIELVSRAGEQSICIGPSDQQADCLQTREHIDKFQLLCVHRLIGEPPNEISGLQSLVFKKMRGAADPPQRQFTETPPTICSFLSLVENH